MKSRGRATPFSLAVTGIVVLAAVLLSASGANSAPPGAHDDGVVRAVGLGWTGLGAGLDRLAAAVLVVLPLGTRALRASIASALLTGACAWACADLASRFAEAALAPLLPRSPRLVAATGAVAALSAVLGPAFQREASAPGGALVGCLVALLALREATRPLVEERARPPASALLLGLAATVDVTVLAATLLLFAPHARALWRSLRDEKGAAIHAGVALVVGASPLLTALAARARVPEIALETPLLAGLVPDRLGSRGLPVLAAFLTSHVGVAMIVSAGLAAVVVAMALRGSAQKAAAARALLDAQLALAAVILVGFACLVWFGTPSNRTSAVVLAASAALHAQAATALAGVALAIARAPVPFAQASAALVVVLELVLPVRSADETLAAREVLPRGATAAWTANAFDGVPPAGVLLVSDRALARRLAAARATGEMRGDVLVVSTNDARSRLSARALLLEPKLAPLFRDLALGSPPEELSLTQIAGARPVLLSFERAWDRALARHLVPVGLFARFDAEPRGAVDRKRAEGLAAPVRDRLVRAVVARRDEDLVTLTASLLRARALGVAATGDRDLLSRALDELHAFAPRDPVATQLVRRMVTSKGPIEVRDLGP